MLATRAAERQPFRRISREGPINATARAGDLMMAVEAGAVGLLTKGGNPANLVSAIRVAAAGGTIWLENLGSPGANQGDLVDCAGLTRA